MFLGGRPLLVLTDTHTWGFASPKGGHTPKMTRRRRAWPGILAQAVGPEVQVLVDAISGRRTDLDGDGDTPTTPSVSGAAPNGVRHAEASGLAHAPLDLVIVMLGTNGLGCIRRRAVAIAKRRGLSAILTDFLVTSPHPTRQSRG